MKKLWKHHFRNSFSVPWSLFVQAVVNTFGKHVLNEEVVPIIKNLVCVNEQVQLVKLSSLLDFIDLNELSQLFSASESNLIK